MNRRNFIKQLLGAAAVVAFPVVASSDRLSIRIDPAQRGSSKTVSVLMNGRIGRIEGFSFYDNANYPASIVSRPGVARSQKLMNTEYRNFINNLNSIKVAKKKYA